MQGLEYAIKQATTHYAQGQSKPLAELDQFLGSLPLCELDGLVGIFHTLRPVLFWPGSTGALPY